jgi:acetyl-CoA acetyltransferase
VVAAERAAASQNPQALLRDKPMSLEDHAAEAIVAEPLRRADLCLESDGACAFVLSSADVARGCRQPPVRLLGATQAIIGGYHDMFLTTPELPPRPPADAVTALLAAHGLSLGDVDVAATYDACSAHVVFDVEAIGFCARGEGVDWVRNPSLRLNTSGGLLAEVYLQGMNHVVELVRQLRGSAASQVDGAEIGLATGQAVTSAAVLARGASS